MIKLSIDKWCQDVKLIKFMKFKDIKHTSNTSRHTIFNINKYIASNIAQNLLEYNILRGFYYAIYYMEV